MQPSTQNAGAAQPIQDVTPPNDSLGNPEGFAEVPVRQAPNASNPIAGDRPLPRPAPPAAAKNEDLDKVLKDVNKDVKETIKKPWQPTKPVMAITLAVLAGLTLSIVAFFAFRKSS